MLPLWVLGSVSAVLFWLVEATWKSFQYTLAARITEIEKYFAGETKHEIFPLQAYRSWFKEWNKVNPISRIWESTALFIVYIPYLVIFVGGILLICLHLFFWPFWSR
jgi:hypothetical protein